MENLGIFLTEAQMDHMKIIMAPSIKIKQNGITVTTPADKKMAREYLDEIAESHGLPPLVPIGESYGLTSEGELIRISPP